MNPFGIRIEFREDTCCGALNIEEELEEQSKGEACHNRRRCWGRREPRGCRGRNHSGMEGKDVERKRVSWGRSFLPRRVELGAVSTVCQSRQCVNLEARPGTPAWE